MKSTSMTFGVLPSRAVFSAHWQEVMGGDELFSFGNDPRVGTDNLTEDELWNEINKAHAEWELTDLESEQDELGSWMSGVLSVMRFDWV